MYLWCLCTGCVIENVLSLVQFEAIEKIMVTE